MPTQRVDLQNCLEYCGTGEVIRYLPVPEASPNAWVSPKFQWLPCEVLLNGASARIDSYINNLHPVKHSGVYSIIERFIEKALPAWDVIYRWPDEFSMRRLDTRDAVNTCKVSHICNETYYGCMPESRPQEEGEAPRDQLPLDHRETEVGRRDHDWFHANHDVELPDPSPTSVPEIRLDPAHVKTIGFFNGAPRVQVIVKLANIHLTPEKPSYDGGTWHIEGLTNEHICATALFYYDNDNLTDCHLDFRHPANSEDLLVNLGYEQEDRETIGRIFAIDPYGTSIQDTGSVLTRQGRAIFFPNLFQHHVSPFRLADPSRPGHRKILALFLVDPAIPIISTANVPPQQRHWWEELTSVPQEKSYSKLPAELRQMVFANVDFPIGEDDAKSLREELMRERSPTQLEITDALAQEWNFCEH